jgi:hypothetical protein
MFYNFRRIKMTQLTNISLNDEKFRITNSSPSPLYRGHELDEFTWSELKQKCVDNDFSGLHVGDWKTVTLATNEQIVMQIAGIDTFYGLCEQYTHHIDWVPKNGLSTLQIWGDNDTCYMFPGYSYLESDIYKFLNNTVYNWFPTEVRNVIINKKDYLEYRENTKYPSKSNACQSLTSDYGLCDLGKIWLLSEYEICGSINYGEAPYSAISAIQYPLFANYGREVRVKKNGATGIDQRWWLRNLVVCGSPYSEKLGYNEEEGTVAFNNTGFCGQINWYGCPGRSLATYHDTYLVVPCFRIGG